MNHECERHWAPTWHSRCKETLSARRRHDGATRLLRRTPPPLPPSARSDPHAWLELGTNAVSGFLAPAASHPALTSGQWRLNPQPPHAAPCAVQARCLLDARRRNRPIGQQRNPGAELDRSPQRHELSLATIGPSAGLDGGKPHRTDEEAEEKTRRPRRWKVQKRPQWRPSPRTTGTEKCT